MRLLTCATHLLCPASSTSCPRTRGKLLTPPPLPTHHRPPGASQMPTPFTCPMDHVLDLTAFDDEASEVKVTFKEHSFHDNPRMPHAVRSSKLAVYVHEVGGGSSRRQGSRSRRLLAPSPVGRTAGCLSRPTSKRPLPLPPAAPDSPGLAPTRR